MINLKISQQDKLAIFFWLFLIKNTNENRKSENRQGHFSKLDDLIPYFKRKQANESLNLYLVYSAYLW